MTWTRKIAFAAALISLAGCAKYHEKPITTEAVDRQLTPPDQGALAESVRQLQHPLLQPIPLDLSDGLSPDEAALVAVMVNPELRAERNRRGVAAAQAIQAGLLPNPQLAGGVEFPFDASPPDDFTAYSLGIEWEATALLGRGDRRRAASEQAASVDLEVAWKEWQVAQQARSAAYAVIALEAQAREAELAQQELVRSLAVASRAVEQHDKTVLDLAAVEATAQELNTLLLTQQGDLARARLTLNRSLGLPASKRIEMRDGESLPSALKPPPQEELLDGLEFRRLDLVALRHGYKSQDATLRAAIVTQFPRIVLGGSVARDASDVRTVGPSATADLPIFDHGQGTIAVENATRDKLFDEYVSRVFAARADLAAAAAEIDSATRQLAAIEAAIPSLERLSQAYGAALKRGDVDVIGFYPLQVTLMQRRLDAIKLRQQLINGWITLELAAGRYLPLPTTATTQQATP